MLFINIHDAKTNLSKYINQVVDFHETIVLCRNGQPVAQLTEYKKPSNIRLGLGKGTIKMAEDFDTPLPEEILKFFS